MDDLDLIRHFAEEDGEPDAGARGRVAAARGARDRGAADRRCAAPVRRRRLRRLTIAAAVAAVLIVAASFGVAQLLASRARPRRRCSSPWTMATSSPPSAIRTPPNSSCARLSPRTASTST